VFSVGIQERDPGTFSLFPFSSALTFILSLNFPCYLNRVLEVNLILGDSFSF